MRYILPILFALALTFGGDGFAQAHVPVVGEEKPTSSVCTEAAIIDIAKLAQAKGINATRMLFFQHVRARQCYVFSFSRLLVRAVRVSPAVETPNSVVVHVIQIEFVEGASRGGPWFAIHVHKVGQGV